MASKNKALYSTYLLIGLAVLLAAVYLINSYQPTPVAGKPFLASETPTPDRIVAKVANTPRLVLTQKEGIWYLEEPIAFPADSGRVQAFLKGLREGAQDNLVSNKKNKHKDFMIDDKSGQHVELYSKGKKVFTCIIGKTAPNDSSYIRKEGSADVYLIKHDVSVFWRHLNWWRDKSILHVAPREITAVEFEFKLADEKDKSFKLLFPKESEAEIMYTGSELKVSFPIADHLRVLLSQLKCGGFKDEVVDYQDARLKITIGLKNGKQHVILVKESKPDSAWFVKLDGYTTNYGFPLDALDEIWEISPEDFMVGTTSPSQAKQ